MSRKRAGHTAEVLASGKNRAAHEVAPMRFARKLKIKPEQTRPIQASPASLRSGVSR